LDLTSFTSLLDHLELIAIMDFIEPYFLNKDSSLSSLEAFMDSIAFVGTFAEIKDFAWHSIGMQHPFLEHLRLNLLNHLILQKHLGDFGLYLSSNL